MSSKRDVLRDGAPNAVVGNTSISPVPFLKWAGGKSQLLSRFDDYLPPDFRRYFEPFVGGGALFFHLSSKRRRFRAMLSDLNEELINAYVVVRDHCEELLKLLGQHKNEPDYYYQLRALDPANLSPLERASRLIYLNKTCFNGLYRVNSRGQFNVPFGSYKNPRMCDPENLRAVSQALASVELRCASFESALKAACSGDFIYLDPPYQPISSTSRFTGYTSSSFTHNDQERLAAVARQLTGRGCLVMLSNSDNDFIRKLYNDFRIVTLYANRAINCRADRRGKISEVLILNY